MNWNPISAVVGVIGSAFEARETRKTQQKSLDAKIAMKRDDNSTNIVFNEQDWELMSKRNENESWKDEWITLIISLPIPMLFLSVFLGVLFDVPLLITAVNDAIKALKDLIPNYEYLLGLVVTAALSIKALKPK